MTQMVPLKEYKVAYWTGGKILKSKLFDTESEAQAYLCRLPSVAVVSLMKLHTTSDGSYSWVILDKGAGRFLPAMSWMYANRKPIGIGCGIFVLYKVLK